LTISIVLYLQKKEKNLRKYNIFITRKLPEPALELLKQKCNIEINPHDRILTKEEIIQGLKDKDGLICLLTDSVDAEIIFSNPDLKVISNYAVGYNNIDIKAATKRKIPVTNTPGVLTETTADLTWALILSIARRIVEGDRFTREKKFKGWAPMFMLGTDVYGKTLGIVGMGRIGKAVAKRAFGFSMKICYYDHHRLSEEAEKKLNLTFISFHELLETSDFVSLHVPLNSNTYHLIGDKELSIMKRTSYLINTSRGEVIDEYALLKVLEVKGISGAGLDVFEKEPVITEGLLKLKNVILLPHIGSATIETRTKMAFIVAENLIAALEGKIPPDIINKEIYK